MHVPGPARPRRFADTGPVVRSVSAAGDGSVWALDQGGVLLQNTEGTVGWLPRPAGRIFVSIDAASDGTVYAVGSYGEFFAYAAGWRELPPPKGVTLATVAVGGASLVWATDRLGEAHRYDPAKQQWSTMPAPLAGPVQSLAVASDGTVCCLSDGAVFRFTGGDWHPVPGAPGGLRALGVGAAGWLWCIDASGAISQYDGDDRPWSPAPVLIGRTPAQISCGDDGTVWVTSAEGGLYQFDAATQGWIQVPGPSAWPTAEIGVGSAASAWAIQSDSSVYQYVKEDSNWSRTSLGMTLSQITARDKTAFWALDSAGWVYGITHLDGNWSLTPQSTMLNWISVASDGTLLGADTGGNLVRYDPGSKTWSSQGRPAGDGPVMQVAAAGRQAALVLSSTGNLYRWNGLAFQPTGAGLPTIVIGMSVLPGGTAYAVGADHRLYILLDAWLPTGSGPLAQVSAAAMDWIWGIGLDGHVVEVVADAHTGQEDGTGAALPRWDTESVFNQAQSTHLWIVNRAAELAGTYGSLGATLANLVQPGKGELGQPFHDQLCQGLYNADWAEPYNDPRYGQPTYKSHFYDPATGENYEGETEPTALTRGADLFVRALGSFRAGNLAAAGYNLGLSLHYFTDVTQPMHAANFTWFSSHPRLGYHTDFEQYALELQGMIAIHSTYTPSSLGNDPKAHIIAAATKAKSRLASIWPESASFSYNGLNDELRNMISDALPAIWKDAILATARYLIAWITEASSIWRDEGETVRAGVGACMIDDQPWVSVIKTNGDLAVNFPMSVGMRLWGGRGTPAGTSIASAVGTAGFGGKIHAYVRSATEHLCMNAGDRTGGTWSDLGVPPFGGAAEDAAPGLSLKVRMGLGATATSTTPVAYVLDSTGVVWYHTVLLSQKWTSVGNPWPTGVVSKAVGASCLYKDHRDYPCTAVITSDGHLRVCGLTPTGQVNQWMDVGTPPGLGIAAPVGICCDQEAIYVAVLGSDGNLWQANLNYTLGKWLWGNGGRPAGQQLSTGVGIAASDGAVYYLVTSASGQLWTTWRSSLGPVWATGGTPDVAVTVNGSVGAVADSFKPFAFAVGSDTHLWEFAGTGTPVP